MAKQRKGTLSQANELRKQIEDAQKKLAELSEKCAQEIAQIALRYRLDQLDIDILEKEFKEIAKRYFEKS